MLSPLRTLRISGLLTMTEEYWLERAIEDELEKVITKYRLQGRDVHNVGKLRERIAGDINALRGTSEWGKLKAKYEPPLQNRVAWCRVCDKPVNMGSVSAWLEDRGGHIYCSQECKDDAPRVFISFSEWKARVKEKGSVTGRRKTVVEGEMVDGDEFTLTWDQVKDFVPSVTAAAPPAIAAAVELGVIEDEIEWE